MANVPTRFLKQYGSRMKDELGRGADVWTFFSPMVFPHAVNLGQGFMNWQPPKAILEKMAEDVQKRVDVHHYSPARGRPRLLEAISEMYSASFRKPAPESTDVAEGVVERDAQGWPVQRPDLGIKLDTKSEIAVTAGANEGMYSILTAFLEPGDEVILIEPFFDQYVCETTFNGGTPVYIPMIPPPAGKRVTTGNDWQFDWDALEQAMSSKKVKAMFFNTPYNPIGKVCTLEELQRLADLCIKYDILVIADEVYDCLTYDGHEHIRMASISGMWERTITVGSAGKSFACTGWRVGWLMGPAHLVTPAFTAHLRITFTVNSLAAEGAAMGLELAKTSDFFKKQVDEYDVRRHELLAVLDEVGLPYSVPFGSYFVLVDASRIQIPADFELPPEVKRKPRDYHVCWFIAKTCDVVVLPATAFYSEQHAHIGERFIRFAFCKDNQMEEASKRLRQVCIPSPLSC
ncbi:arylformamidase [Malassezia pachydermatis]